LICWQQKQNVNKGKKKMIVHIIEVCFSLGLFVNAFLYIPQALRIYRAKHANDVSFLTFAGFNLINLLAVLHGIVKDDKVLIIGFSLSLITNTIVTGMIIYYRFVAKNNSNVH
jgi:MtN3 and saliva related transmembrane protein